MHGVLKRFPILESDEKGDAVEPFLCGFLFPLKISENLLQCLGFQKMPAFLVYYGFLQFPKFKMLLFHNLLSFLFAAAKVMLYFHSAKL